MNTCPGQQSPQLDLQYLVQNGIRPYHERERLVTHAYYTRDVTSGPFIGTIRPHKPGDKLLRTLRLGKGLNPQTPLEWLEQTQIDTISIRILDEISLNALQKCKQAFKLSIDGVPNLLSPHK